MSQEDEEFEFRARAEAEAAAAQPDASGPNAGLAAFATTPSDSSAPQGADGSGFGNWLKTQYGIPLARGAINAVTGLPLMAMDVGVASRNAIQSGSINATGPYELPSTAVQRAMNQYLPAPTTAYGKIGEAVNTGILGAGASYAGIPGLTAPTYGNVPPGFVSPSAREPNLTMGQEQAAAGGQDLGMRLTPGRETGSRALQQIDARLESVPATSGPFNRLYAGNQRILNRTVAQSIGENANEVSSPVMGQAYGRMGDTFNAARSPTNILATNPEETTNALNAIDEEASGLIPGSIRDNPLVQRLQDLTSNGSITTEQLGKLSSKLGNVAYKQMSTPGGDRDMADALYAVKDHADELLMRTMSPEDAAEYAATKAQYRNLMNVSGSNVTNSASGNVSGLSLANRLALKDRTGFTFGANQSPMYAAARFTKAFPSIVGDSGTATRSEGLAGLALAVPGNLLSWGYMKGAAPAYRAITSLPSAFNQGLPPAGLAGLSEGIADYMQH